MSNPPSPLQAYTKKHFSWGKGMKNKPFTARIHYSLPLLKSCSASIHLSIKNSKGNSSLLALPGSV